MSKRTFDAKDGNLGDVEALRDWYLNSESGASTTIDIAAIILDLDSRIAALEAIASGIPRLQSAFDPFKVIGNRYGRDGSPE